MPVIELYPNGLVLRYDIPGSPTFKSWIEIYMDYLEQQGVDLANTSISCYDRDRGWVKNKATKTEDGWRFSYQGEKEGGAGS